MEGPAEYLPHEAPMVLLDAVDLFDAEASAIETRVKICEDNLFFDRFIGGVPNLLALEYMAQTIGCFAGLADRAKDPNFKQELGFVLGARRMKLLIDKFEEGKTYKVKAVKLFFDEEMASFDCSIFDEAGALCANAILTVYRPKDIKKLEFLKDG